MENYIFWAVLGLLLMASELVTGLLISLFLGLAALAVGLLSYTYFFGNWTAELAVYSLLSMSTLYFLRGKVKGAISKGDGSSNMGDAHNTVLVKDAIAQGQSTTVQYQGTPWTAVNIGHSEIPAGNAAVIVKTEGIKLLIKKS
jgi:membrane protein implicated in regulation of membrane protease activity